MLSIDRCRQILGPDCHLTDQELEQLREELCALANITITAFIESTTVATSNGTNATLHKGIPQTILE